jgi:hypothetical protein
MLLVMAVLFSAFLVGGASQALAYNGYQSSDGYWDRNGYHQYEYHNHHRGYWNQHDGVRFWINIG